MNTKHTPGPWKIVYITSETASGPTPYPRAIMSAGIKMAELPERSTSCMMDEREANARLIAAAPDLLAALRNFEPVDVINFAAWMERYQLAMNAARAAIAKATTNS